MGLRDESKDGKMSTTFIERDVKLPWSRDWRCRFVLSLIARLCRGRRTRQALMRSVKIVPNFEYLSFSVRSVLSKRNQDPPVALAFECFDGSLDDGDAIFAYCSEARFPFISPAPITEGLGDELITLIADQMS